MNNIIEFNSAITYGFLDVEVGFEAFQHDCRKNPKVSCHLNVTSSRYTPIATSTNQIDQMP
jgi:hypothetical protein